MFADRETDPQFLLLTAPNTTLEHPDRNGLLRGGIVSIFFSYFMGSTEF